MNRRDTIKCISVGALGSLAGCIATVGRKGDQADDGEENSYTDCNFHVEIIDSPPEDATIVSAEEHQLLQYEVINRIFDVATDPDEDHVKGTRRSGEYEQFGVAANSEDKFEKVSEELQNLPAYNESGYPSGVYLTTKSHEIIVAITQQCIS